VGLCQSGYGQFGLSHEGAEDRDEWIQRLRGNWLMQV